MNLETALEKVEILHVLPERILRIHRNGRCLDLQANRVCSIASILSETEVPDDIQNEGFVEQMQAHMFLTLDSGMMQCFEYQTRDQAGVHTYEVRIFRECDERVLAIVRDISASKQAEERLVKLERQRAFGQMSRGISHNFNNILTGILGPAQLIHLKSDHPLILQMSHMIVSSARRASELIRMLCAAGQTNEHKNLYAVPFQDALTPVIQRLEDRLMHRDRSLSIVTQIETDLPVLGTQEGLVLILEHLLINAIEASKRDGTIVVGVRQNEKWVELYVEDDGVGMDETVVSQVFDPFFTTKTEVGAGLGLTAVQGVVVCWGGDVVVESELGKGSCFYVRLPIVHESERHWFIK